MKGIENSTTFSLVSLYLVRDTQSVLQQCLVRAEHSNWKEQELIMVIGNEVKGRKHKEMGQSDLGEP